MAHEINHFPGTRFRIRAKDYLYFGGTAYLGLQTDAAFQELYIANVRTYGTNYGSSRNSNVRLTVFEETENYLAKIVGSQDCITLSSGYLAGQFVAKQFNGPGYARFYAPRTHSALLTSKEKCYADYDELKAALHLHLSEPSRQKPVVFLDSIDFSGINYPDFNGLLKLPLHEIILVADDSHGIGIIGENGRGSFEKLSRLQPKELIVCCSLGKGYGVQAGAIFGSKDRIRDFQETDLFGGASPAAPSALATILKAPIIYSEKRKLLRDNLHLFRKDIKELARYIAMPGHPTFGFFNQILSQKLERKNIIVTNFGYPKENDELMSRIVISANHTKEDIQLLCSVLNTP